MERTDLSIQDIELLEKAVSTSDQLYVEGKHEVAAAVRTSEGLVFSGIHIETQVDWADICGEVAAICCMISSGYRDIETIVAVWRSPKNEHFLLSPCGRCREIIFEMNREAWVIVGTIEKPYKVRISKLLPLRNWDSE